jgi:hypothetical protein
MGTPLTKAGALSDADSHAIEVDYPRAGARAGGGPPPRPFRFVYTSGRIAERDQDKPRAHTHVQRNVSEGLVQCMLPDGTLARRCCVVLSHAHVSDGRYSSWFLPSPIRSFVRRLSIH